MASTAVSGKRPFVCRSCSQVLHLRAASRSADSPLHTLRPSSASYTLPAVVRSPSDSHRQLRQPRKAWERPAHTSTTVTLPGHRLFATQISSDFSTQDQILPQPRGVTHLPNRRLISLSGPDSSKFLQGLVTNNIDPEREQPYYSAFLDARGRVLWDVFIWPSKEAGERLYHIEVDGEELGAISKHLKKHKLRSKIVVRTVEADELEVLAAWGHEIQAEVPSANTTVLEDPRAPGFGYRILYNKKRSGADFPATHLSSLQQYRLRRYRFGVPEGQQEIIRESALPMEYNIDLSQGIHFGKGCYVGQELTIRTKHTGVVRKRLLPVQLYHAGDSIPGDDAPVKFDSSWAKESSVSADIKQLDAEGSIKKGRAAGKLISSIGNVGLALCRLEMMTPMRVSAEGGTFKPGMEFAAQLSREEKGHEDEESVLRVKAVVPPWLSQREEELWGKGRQKSMTHQ